MNILDSNQLLAIKSRHGLQIRDAASTSLYVTSKKLERLLSEKLDEYFKYEMDKYILIEKILSKMKTPEAILVAIDYVSDLSNDNLFEIASNVKKFTNKVRSLVVE